MIDLVDERAHSEVDNVQRRSWAVKACICSSSSSSDSTVAAAAQCASEYCTIERQPDKLIEYTELSSIQLAIGEMTDAGESDVQQDNIDVLLWSLSAWHRQQQRYREWIARNRLEQKRLRATSKVLLNRRRHPEFIAV